MPLPDSGLLRLSFVPTEFGGAAPHKLSEYYGVDDGVPTSGVLKLSDFYRKRADKYRYWRFNCTAVVGPGTFVCNELALAETIGGANIIPSNSVIAFSKQYQTNYATKAVDKNESSVWTTNQAGGWIALDIGSKRAMAEFRFRTTTVVAYAPRDFSWQVSNDNVNWITKKSWAGVSTGWAANSWRSFSF